MGKIIDISSMYLGFDIDGIMGDQQTFHSLIRVSKGIREEINNIAVGEFTFGFQTLKHFHRFMNQRSTDQLRCLRSVKLRVDEAVVLEFNLGRTLHEALFPESSASSTTDLDFSVAEIQQFRHNLAQLKLGYVEMSAWSSLGSATKEVKMQIMKELVLGINIVIVPFGSSHRKHGIELFCWDLRGWHTSPLRLDPARQGRPDSIDWHTVIGDGDYIDRLPVDFDDDSVDLDSYDTDGNVILDD